MTGKATRKPVFSESQVAELRELLGREADIIPVLEEIARSFADDSQEWARVLGTTLAQQRQHAREHVELARRLRKRAEALLQILSGIDPRVFGAARYLGFLTSDPNSPVWSDQLGLRRVRETGPQGALKWTSEETRSVLGELVRDATAWETRAQRASTKKRGRNAVVRFVLAYHVGGALTGRVRLTKSADGKFARVLGIVYDAVGIKGPEDLYDDVVRAIDDLAWRRPPAQ